VTGCSSNHFAVALLLVTSIWRFHPDTPIIFYDLGLSAKEAATIQRTPLTFRRFNYSAFPDYFNVSVRAGEYAWKPVIIHEVLQEFSVVLWVDAGNRLHSSADPVFEYIAKNGFYSFRSAGDIKRWTHPATVAYLHGEEQLNRRNCGATFVGFRRDALLPLVTRWKECALVKACIAPKGSNRRNHRQDQAALSILVWQDGRECKTEPMLIEIISIQNRESPKRTEIERIIGDPALKGTIYGSVVGDYFFGDEKRVEPLVNKSSSTVMSRHNNENPNRTEIERTPIRGPTLGGTIHGLPAVGYFFGDEIDKTLSSAMWVSSVFGVVLALVVGFYLWCRRKRAFTVDVDQP